jgi:hypothetical protein
VIRAAILVRRIVQYRCAVFVAPAQAFRQVLCSALVVSTAPCATSLLMVKQVLRPVQIGPAKAPLNPKPKEF